MNVLVTGGAGFLGSMLVDRLLAEGHTVDVIDVLSTGSLANLAAARRDAAGRLKIHQCDVRDDGLAGLLTRREPEVVYHLATSTDRRSAVPATESAHIDVVGTVQVCQAAVAAGARKVVAAGSTRARVASSVAATARAMASDIAMAHREAHGIECTAVDLPTVYGPRQRPGVEASVVATFVDRLVHGQPCVIHGDGTQSRDLLYVDDAIDALAKAAGAGDGLRLAVGTGTQTGIVDLYRTLAAIVGTDAAPVPGAARDDEPDTVAVDPDRAGIYLGWSAFTPLADGLSDTVVSVRA